MRIGYCEGVEERSAVKIASRLSSSKNLVDKQGKKEKLIIQYIH